MDDIRAVRWDVRVACAILLVTVLNGAIFFWKRQGASDLPERDKDSDAW
jgi:hypothetical protein